MIRQPNTQYARSGDLSIAYQVVGDGPIDILVVPGTVSHVELIWEVPTAVHFLERVASFARVLMFDRRGTGLSDPVTGVPTLEERIDDARAVMEAAGSQRAAIFGVSEGVPMGLLFAATHPEMVSELVLYGGMARSTWAEDYPWATPREALLESSEQMAPHLYDGAFIEIMAPSIQDDPNARALFAKLQRYSTTPAMLQQSYLMFLDIDVRSLLPTINVPTLVLHRHGDMAVNRRGAEWMAQQIPGARYVELPGIDHSLFAGDSDLIADEVEEFLTGARQSRDVERVLATVMFTDIVDSTTKASAMGDRAWRDLLEAQNEVLRRELARFRGREVKTLGDGMLATFDGPARAIRCAQAAIDAVRALGIDLRVGLHTGEVEMVEGADGAPDVAGIAVHIAARVGAKAGTGEVLVSGTVKDLVAGSGIRFADRGEHELKGIPDQWRLFAVEGGAQ
ncbi:MAG TPA: adenylate/guanylate cyclase domain-containing protein [Aeromicrobium sp.]|nr:adenylate/guanylate cyclase domain-containing protein [Aeromicrobium sp.]